MDMDADADVDADVNVDGGVDVDVDADLDLNAGTHANHAENLGDLAWCAEKERITCSLNSHLQRHDVGPWVHTRDDCVADAELHVFIHVCLDLLELSGRQVGKPELSSAF